MKKNMVYLSCGLIFGDYLFAYRYGSAKGGEGQ